MTHSSRPSSSVRRPRACVIAHRLAEQPACRARAEGEHDLGLDDLELAVEPEAAGVDLPGGRRLVQPPLAAPDELEVLDRVGDVDLRRGRSPPRPGSGRAIAPQGRRTACRRDLPGRRAPRRRPSAWPSSAPPPSPPGCRESRSGSGGMRGSPSRFPPASRVVRRCRGGPWPSRVSCDCARVSNAQLEKGFERLDLFLICSKLLSYTGQPVHAHPGSFESSIFPSGRA